MNEWKSLQDVVKNIPKEKYKSLSKLRMPVRYKRGIGYNEDLSGVVGKIDKNRFNFLRPNRRVRMPVEVAEVFINDKIAGKLFVWSMSK